MTKILLFNIVILFLLACSDNKIERPIESDYYLGEFEVLKNGKKWNGLSAATKLANNDYFELSLKNDSSLCFKDELLSIRFIPLRIGEYKLVNDSLIEKYNENSDSCIANFLTTIECDVLCDVYNTINNSCNYISIIDIKEETKEVYGCFGAKFFLFYDCEWTLESPDAINFTKGFFRAKLIELPK